MTLHTKNESDSALTVGYLHLYHVLHDFNRLASSWQRTSGTEELLDIVGCTSTSTSTQWTTSTHVPLASTSRKRIHKTIGAKSTVSTATSTLKNRKNVYMVTFWKKISTIITVVNIVFAMINTALLFRPLLRGGGRNYILKWVFFCSVNFGRSIYSPQRVQTGIIRKLAQRRIWN